MAWIVVIALSAAGLTWLITGQIIRAVTILVVFCPCALVLATPPAIMAAIGILVLGAGLYYLAREKHDSESEKIYTIVSIIGGIVAAVCAMLLLI